VPAPSSSPRHWFVTGASGGLGRHLAERALREGDYVTATARRPESLRELAEEHGERLTVAQLDLARPAQVAEVLARTLAGRPVDVVVNNAGYAVIGAAEEMTPEQIRDQLEVLLHAPIAITRAFLAPMRERGGGRILQISSLGGQTVAPAHSAYHAGKWGLEGYSECVAREVADFGVHLTIVQLGATRTGFVSALRLTEETAPYRDNAVGQTRRFVANLPASELGGDPAKVAALLYETATRPEPPVRLAVGPDVVETVGAALASRAALLESQREEAASVAF
jgi:NAD(P)-dependent dehydrogenase (short-subunit alcohol dehydrogenase family)